MFNLGGLLCRRTWQLSLFQFDKKMAVCSRMLLMIGLALVARLKKKKKRNMTQFMHGLVDHL
jgi:uncharacterized membrane protein